jgi:hypothetical protein
VKDSHTLLLCDIATSTKGWVERVPHRDERDEMDGGGDLFVDDDRKAGFSPETDRRQRRVRRCNG